MKAGIATSTIAHVALIGFGLLSLSAPAALEVGDTESMPVEIVPIEALTQMQQGEKTAPMRELSAPKPTERPALPTDGEKVGDAEVEMETPPTPEPAKRPVETAAAPPPAPTPAPAEKPEPKPEPAPAPAAQPAPPPATERTAKPEPAQPVKPEPTQQAAVAEQPEQQAVPLPAQAPAPQARPQPPQAQTAKAPERTAPERPAERQTPQQPTTEKSDFNADDIAALLDKQKPAGGGTQRSTREAALGGQRNDPGTKLSQSEMDALRGQIQRCWNVPAGALEAENLRVSVKFSLDRSGAISVTPQIVSGGGAAGVERAAAESARRAVLQCAPYNLPAEKYEAWADVIVNFDPKDMF